MRAAKTWNGKRAEQSETSDRPILDSHKQRSELSGWVAIANAKKSAAKYAEIMQEEAANLKAKGVFLENRNGVYTEAFCRYAAIANLLEGQTIWFSIHDISRLVLGLEMEITWQDEEKSVYRLSDDDNFSRLFSIRKDGNFLKVWLLR